MLRAGKDHRAARVLDEVLQLGPGVLPVEGDGHAAAHPRGPLRHHEGDVVGAQEGDPLLLEVPVGTRAELADLPGQAEAAQVEVLVCVAAMLVDKGEPVPEGRGTAEDRGTAVRACGRGCVQVATHSTCPGGQPAGSHGPGQAPEGHPHMWRRHRGSRCQLAVPGWEKSALRSQPILA